MSKTSFAQGQLKSLVERIERLEEEKKTVAADIKEVYAEAKGHGFNVTILREVIKLRRKDADERSETEAMLDLYLQALGMLPEDADDVEEPPTKTDPSKQPAEKEATYSDAVSVVKDTANASTSYLQRTLQIGYNKAASFIERMQAEGIVSARDEAGKRAVLYPDPVPHDLQTGEIISPVIAADPGDVPDFLRRA